MNKLFNKIFTFYRLDNPNVSIHIAACTLFEAVDALTKLDYYARFHYNLKEYKMERIDPFPYLGIEEEYRNLQYFISDNDYNMLIRKSRNKIVNDKSTAYDIVCDKYLNAKLVRKPTITEKGEE